MEMVGEATEFYRGLFEERVVDRSAGVRFLDLLEEKVPEGVRAALELPFSVEEVGQALRGMKVGKVPDFGGGVWGVSEEFGEAFGWGTDKAWAVGNSPLDNHRELVLKHRRLYQVLKEKLRPVGGTGVGLGKELWLAMQTKGLDNRLKDLNWLAAYGRLPGFCM
ncbi:hypothetical protein SKAU_G00387320 [Synaphobranchus kaupii]|uniref:Uncharacterized protein n=1 Tax=Synaphobranchus kaupii TaxID=118154 RepID=A0A9Q1EAX0_SYNKA|nr:hypothetical protein SKAU_G00387320 [Synaphobranchus kaupii]